MTPFRFPLEKVLEWRRTQLDLAEAQFRRQAAALAELDRAYAEAEATGNQAELQVRGWNPLAGRDLAALGIFRLYMKKREGEIDLSREDCRKELAARRAAMLEARRRLRLLERLRERRYEEWRLANERELESLASESYLARWSRQAGAPGSREPAS